MNSLPFGIDLYQLMARLLVLFTCFPVHEYAHALVAVQLGDNTPERQGRLTLSPFAHLNPFGSLALLAFGFGWANPVQIDVGKFKHRKSGMAITAFAGPASNILMAAIILIVMKIIVGTIGSDDGIRGNPTLFYLIQILSFMIHINLWLAVLNLLPIPPLDGSRILGAVLPSTYYFKMARYEAPITVGLLVLLYTGILTIPMTWLSGRLYWVIDFLTKPVDLIFRWI